MLQRAKRARRWLPAAGRRAAYVRADLLRTPIAERSIDLLFSNLALHWCAEPADVFTEWRRILRSDGLLLLSALGPNSWRDLRSVLSPDPDLPAAFPDIQAIGDMLLAAGFVDPVADSEDIELTYRSPDRMVSDLQASGTLALLGCEGHEALDRWRTVWGDGPCKMACEIIYATAYGPGEGQPRKTAEGDVATFSVDSLRRTVRR